MRGKRKTAWILMLVLAAGLLVSCKKEEQDHVFRATITEMQEKTLLFKPEEGSAELRSSDLFSASIQHMPASPEPEVGDVIEITYNGDILETYPARLGEIKSMKVVEKAPKKTADPEEESTEEPVRTAIVGPYGKLSVQLPDGWTAQTSAMDENRLMYGLYGLILQPEAEEKGQVEVFYADDFAVCGTGLSQETRQLAGVEAWVGTYEENRNWSFVNFRGELEGVVAQTKECDSWSEASLEEAMQILDTVAFDRDTASGGAYRFVSESENEEIGLLMELHDVTPTGAVVRFIRYDEERTEGMDYGQGFLLVRLENDEWVDVPTVIDDYGFTEEAYPIPAGGEAEMVTDWQWIYGALEPGTYRIRKTVSDELSSGGYAFYTMEAEFIIA